MGGLGLDRLLVEIFNTDTDRETGRAMGTLGLDRLLVEIHSTDKDR